MERERERQKTANSVLFDLIYQFPLKLLHFTSISPLQNQISLVKNQLRKCKLQNPEEIERVCKENSKLVLIAKLLKENYIKSSFEIAKAVWLKQQKEGENVSNKSEEPLWNLNEKELERLRLETISMFSEMMSSQKMVDFLGKIHIRFHIFRILIKLYAKLELSCLKKKEFEKGLRFIYQWIRVSNSAPPFVFVHLISRLLCEYSKDYEKQLIELTMEEQKNHEKKERMRLCFSYIFESSLTITKKNPQLAAYSGILATLFLKATEGKLTHHKVIVITEIIIDLFSDQNTRNIVLENIEFGKMFAVFTSDFQCKQGSSHSKPDQISACSTMIEMLLTEWSTLIYFIREENMLKFFLTGLKVKNQSEINKIGQTILLNLLFRIFHYSKRKIKQSRNILMSYSNCLIFRGLLLALHIFQTDWLLDLVQHFEKGQLMDQICHLYFEYFKLFLEDKKIEKMLLKKIQTNSLIQSNGSNVMRFMQLKATATELRLKSFCSQSLISTDFSKEQLKSHLLTLFKSNLDPEFQATIKEMNTAINEFNFQLCSMAEYCSLLFDYCQMGIEASKSLPWHSDFLPLSTYFSKIIEFLKNQKNSQISEFCTAQMKKIILSEKESDWQSLQINLLDDIGRHFHAEDSNINFLKTYIADIKYSHKISRILMWIDQNPTRVIEKMESVVSAQMYLIICKAGSVRLVLAIVELIKLNCLQNEFMLVHEHATIIFSYLIYHESEDVVFATIQLLQNLLFHNKEIERLILEMDCKKISHPTCQKRVYYLLLNFQEGIKRFIPPEDTSKKDQIHAFLPDQLENWIKTGDNLKKNYSTFLTKQIKNYNNQSITTKDDYLNLGFEPANFHRLVFLPWAIQVNSRIFAAFVQHKVSQDRIILKIDVNISIVQEITIEDLFIGSHQYTKYLESKSHHLKHQKDSRKIKLTLEEVRKQWLKDKNKPIKKGKFLIKKDQAMFFIKCDNLGSNQHFVVQKIHLSVNLSIEIYRPISHPLSFLNLLIGTQLGFDFLRKRKFIEHCLELIKQNREDGSLVEEIKSSLVCLATLCCSRFITLIEKLQVYDHLKLFITSQRHSEIQEISYWILNIIVHEPQIRRVLQQDNQLTLVPSRDGKWIVFPNLHSKKHKIIAKFSAERHLKLIKTNLPQLIVQKNAILEQQKSINASMVIQPSECKSTPTISPFNSLSLPHGIKFSDEKAYRYIHKQLNEIQLEKESEVRQFQEIQRKMGNYQNVTAKLFQKVINYISLINFPPEILNSALDIFTPYICSNKFEADFPQGLHLLS